MKTDILKGITSGFALVAAMAQAANPLAINWKADTAGECSGAFTDTAHWNWSKGSYPGESVANGAGQQAVFNTLTSPYVATLPTGDVNLPFSVRIDLTDGGDATLSGLGATWLTPEVASDYYATYAFRCHYAGNCFFRNEVNGLLPWLRAEDFAVRQRAEAGLVRLDLTGDFNFYDPVGTARNNTYSIFEKGAANTTGVITFDGSTRFYQLSFFSGNGYEGFTTNKVVFAGGTHFVSTLNVGGANNNGRERARVIEVTAGGVLTLANSLTPWRPDTGAAGDGFYLNVTDGGIYRGGWWDTAAGAKGRAYVNVDGGVWQFAGSMQIGSAAGSTTTVSVVDGAFTNAGSTAFGYLGTDAAGVASSRCRLAARNAGFRFGKDTNNKTQVNGDTKLDFVDSAVTNTSAFVIGETAVVACPEVSLTGGSFRGIPGVNSSLSVGASSSGRLVLNGCDAKNMNFSCTVGGGSASNTRLANAVTGTVEIVGGATMTDSARNLQLGRRTGATGILNLQDGEVVVGYLKLGEYGCGILNVSGGSMTVTVASGTTFGEFASDETRASEINVSGGVLATPAVTLANAAGRTVVANLTGGAWRVPSVKGGSGTSVLRANGGRIVPAGATTAAAPLVSGLSEMTLSGAGLAVDVSTYNAFINQAIAGTGPLMADGAYTLTLVAGMTATAPVGARGGATLDLNGVVPGGLVLGDATTCGRIKVSAGSTVALTGPAVVRNVEIVPDAVLAKSVTPYTLFTTSVEPDAATVAAWTAAKTAVGMIPADAVDEFTVVEREGSWCFDVTVREPVVTELTVADGETRIVSEALDFGRKDWLVCTVGGGATLMIDGTLNGGKLVKAGKGELVLENAGNVFHAGFELQDGRLVVRSAAALGGYADATSYLAGGTLVFPADYVDGTFGGSLAVDTSRGGVTNAVVACDADVTLAFPTIVKGALLKRGVGNLTLVASESRTYDGGYQSNFDILRGNAYVYRSRHLTFPADGSSPTNYPCGELAVVEGRLTVRGASPEIELKLNGNVIVGVPTEMPLAAEPELVVESVLFRLQDSFLYLACGLCADCSATAPGLTLTNGTTLASSGLKVLSQSQYKDLRPRMIVDGAVLGVSNFYASDQNEAGSANYCTPSYVFRNGGRFSVSVVQKGPVAITFDGGEWVRGASETVALSATYESTLSFGPAGFVVSSGNTADFAGATYTNAVLAGAGTVAGVTLDRPTLRVTTDGTGASAALTFEATAGLVGRIRVDVGRTEANPLSASDAPFRVATFAGAVPDLARWKLVGSGDRGVTARFAAVGSDVYAIPSHMLGSVVIFR